MYKTALYLSSFISCVIIVFLMFQFWDEKYERKYQRKYLYKIPAMVYVVVVMSVNILMNPLYNLLANMVMIGGVSYGLYEGEKFGRYRIYESAALFTILSLTEAAGVYLIDFLMENLQIMPANQELLRSIEYIFSKLVMLFLYYVLFVRLWRRRVVRTTSQYFLYIAMFFFGMINILAMAFLAAEERPALLMMVVCSIILLNMFLLLFMKYLDERNFYKLQNEMMRQQEELRLRNYEVQNNVYRKALSILHDVKKHISMIEALYGGNREEAPDYTRQINDMLKPLMPIKYVNNPILNWLLTDKLQVADRYGILFEMDVSLGDVDFMKSIDITTLFGNLLDNAVEAAGKCSAEKYIGILLKRHNQMLYIRIENSIESAVPIRNGMISERKKGIGILNIERCVDAYGGEIIYKNSSNRLVCEICLTIEK